MKKVAFTFGLAFFALGLFAQNAATNNAYAAKPAATHVSAQKKEPAKAAPTAQAKAGMATAAKPGEKASPSVAKTKPASGVTTSTKKHARRHKAKTKENSAVPATKSAAHTSSKQK